jgi:hypothetical protein
MKITLSIDEQVLTRARALAQRRGLSLSLMVQESLDALIAADRSQVVAELEQLWQEAGDSGGGTWSRDELYDRSERRK